MIVWSERCYLGLHGVEMLPGMRGATRDYIE